MSLIIVLNRGRGLLGKVNINSLGLEVINHGARFVMLSKEEAGDRLGREGTGTRRVRPALADVEGCCDLLFRVLLIRNLLVEIRRGGCFIDEGELSVSELWVGLGRNEQKSLRKEDRLFELDFLRGGSDADGGAILKRLRAARNCVRVGPSEGDILGDLCMDMTLRLVDDLFDF